MLRQQANSLPTHPGVYIMRDAKGNVLYIGKAKNLKRRVASYFREQSAPRLKVLVEKIHDIEVTITQSEKEALLLENSLIKSLKPRYNVFLKDDKSYPYLYLSEHAEYPRLTYHRGPQKLPGQYFGPYPSALAVKETLNLLQKIFKLRQCVDSFFKNRSRPCLQYQINRCAAPCVGYITPEDYQVDVAHTVQFLTGKKNAIVDDLGKKMQDCSAQKEYEQAAKYRDEIANLRKIQEKQVVVGQHGNVDILAAHIQGGHASVQTLLVREGTILGSRSYYPNLPLGDTAEEVMQAFLMQFYLNYAHNRDFPEEIIISHDFEEKSLVENVLQEQTGKTIKITTNVRSHRAKWLQMAKENAQKSLQMRIGRLSTLSSRFVDLQKVLGLSQPIRQIMCFDVSHTAGEATYASSVVFDEHGPCKKDYRSYQIKLTNIGDDFAAMEEALMRRFQKLKEKDAALPDILLVDGGKGQLSRAKKVMEECQIVDMLIIGVAKGQGRKPGLETLYIYRDVDNETLQVNLPPTSHALQLILQIRDEAHRFALSHHRKKRAKSRKTSFLENIPGVGPKRRQELLQHFGGKQALMAASKEAIAGVSGISDALAEMIYSVLHNNSD